MTTQFQETTAGQSQSMPAKVVIYGVPKIGKTRFAAQADDVFFLNIEGGLDYLPTKVRSTPKLNLFQEVLGWLEHIYNDDKFTCGTIALDSLDWCEKLAQEKLSKAHNGTSLSDQSYKPFAYHAGYTMAAQDAAIVLKWLDAIYKKKGIKSIVIAHSQIKEVNVPTKDPYQQHQLKLTKQFASIVNEWADLTLFADYAFHVTKDGKTSEPKPVLYAGGSAAFTGGGRMQLDKELPIDYQILKQHIEKGTTK